MNNNIEYISCEITNNKKLSLSFIEKIIKLKGFARGCSVEYGKVNKAIFKYNDITITYKVIVLENSNKIKIIITW